MCNIKIFYDIKIIRCNIKMIYNIKIIRCNVIL